MRCRALLFSVPLQMQRNAYALPQCCSLSMHQCPSFSTPFVSVKNAYAIPLGVLVQVCISVCVSISALVIKLCSVSVSQ